MSSATSDPIKLRCPSCGKKLGFPPGASGRKAKCPACSHVFRVTAQATPAFEPPPIPVVPQSTSSSQQDVGAEPNSLFDALANAEESAEEVRLSPEEAAASFQTEPSRQVHRATFGGNAIAEVKPKSTESEGSGLSITRLGGSVHSLSKGCLLSGVGALLGAFIWYAVAKATGYHIGYVAWLVGILAGLGMTLGMRSASVLAGGIAAVIGLFGILAGYLMIVQWVVLPELAAEIKADDQNIENRREALIENEAAKIFAQKKIDPEEATEEQEDSVYGQAKSRVEGWNDEKVNREYESYKTTSGETDSDLSVGSLPTGFLVVLLGLVFGWKSIIFIILAMTTAFRLGASGLKTSSAS